MYKSTVSTEHKIATAHKSGEIFTPPNTTGKHQDSRTSKNVQDSTLVNEISHTALLFTHK